MASDALRKDPLSSVHNVNSGVFTGGEYISMLSVSVRPPGSLERFVYLHVIYTRLRQKGTGGCADTGSSDESRVQ